MKMIIGYRLTENGVPVDDFDTMAQAQQKADDRAYQLDQSPVTWLTRFEGDMFGMGYSAGPNDVTYHITALHSDDLANV